jgi:hypothetical protein
MGYTGGLANEKDISIVATFFAQFVAHDLSLSERPATNRTPIDILDPNDPFLFMHDGTPKCCLFIPGGPGKRIDVRRSAGSIVNGHFETNNLVNSYLDANQIYGSDDFSNSRIRSFVDGKLILQDYDIDISQYYAQPNLTTVVHVEDVLPTVAMTGLPKDPANLVEPNNQVFSAGDPRSSENMLINTFHVIFAREHNRLCDVYKLHHASWTDEELFQKARTIVIAEYQNIIYQELLPSVLGLRNVRNLIGHYQGYDSSVDVTTSNLFTTVAFRYGHTTVPEKMFFQNECGEVDTSIGIDGQLTQGGQNGGTATDTNPFTLSPMNLMGLARNPDNYIRIALRTPDEEFDHLMVPNIQNININAPVITGIDIAAADFKRARLHGIPNYHTVRKFWFSDNQNENSIYGRPNCPANDTTPSPDPMECFLELTDNCTLANLLREVYGKLNRIDPLLGMLVERPMRQSALGPTMTRVILEQFKRSRDGDRFWWQNLPSSVLKNSERSQIRHTKLSDILRRNSGVQFIQDNVFFVMREENPACDDE